MNVWDTYTARANIRGLTKRNAALQREKMYLRNHLPDSLSFHSADIIDTSKLVPGINREFSPGEISKRDVAIINSDTLETKSIISMPDETLRHGDIVSWMGQYWLISEKDYNTEVYTKCKMTQCNYLLRWIDDSGQMFEEWCVVEDGTKYLIGEFEDRNFVYTRGDSRLSVMLPRNQYTALLGRNIRVLIDEPGTGELLSYQLTKPLKLGSTYGDEGVYKFVLQEVVSTDDDNFDLRIADYYKHFDKITGNEISIPTPTIDTNNTTSNGRQVWL